MKLQPVNKKNVGKNTHVQGVASSRYARAWLFGVCVYARCAYLTHTIIVLRSCVHAGRATALRTHSFFSLFFQGTLPCCGLSSSSAHTLFRFIHS
uniref:Uncharacterized protein n=1 Tax=Leishmania guyanensis TaxID=5670 RepID=A0A1E1IZ21_LEIGU|nr:Hypothetical protein BN36_2640480 [Leishmania guyanensis]CCM16568.1 Hypothetical protein BN36_2640720 [Leishmania guyanensis]